MQTLGKKFSRNSQTTLNTRIITTVCLLLLNLMITRFGMGGEDLICDQNNNLASHKNKNLKKKEKK